MFHIMLALAAIGGGGFTVTEGQAAPFVVTYECEPSRAATRPVVVLYTAKWCAPCQSAKAALKAAKLPFDIEYIDVSNGGQPSWCVTIPAFAWDVNGKTRYVLGFPGVKQLIKTWEGTQKPAPKAAANHYTPGWTWPGDLRHHLQATHGISDASALTQDQAEQLHDALHNGWTYEHIKRYAIRHGLIR